MQAIQPYLLFNGNCRAAMEFYAAAFGETLNSMTYAEGPDASKSGGDGILHANFGTGPAVLMASDAMPGQPVPEGRNFCLSVICDSREEQKRLFAALEKGGTVIEPLQGAF